MQRAMAVIIPVNLGPVFVLYHRVGIRMICAERLVFGGFFGIGVIACVAARARPVNNAVKPRGRAVLDDPGRRKSVLQRTGERIDRFVYCRAAVEGVIRPEICVFGVQLCLPAGVNNARKLLFGYSPVKEHYIIKRPVESGSRIISPQIGSVADVLIIRRGSE